MKCFTFIRNAKMRINLLFCFVCFLIMIIPISLSAESIKCDLAAGTYQIIETDTKEFRIKMDSDGYGDLQSPGDPLLPQKIIELKVPYEGNLSNLKFTVDSADVVTLPMQYDIVPGSPFVTNKSEYWGEGKSIVKGKNVRVYGKDAFFPEATIELLPSVMKKELASQEGQKRTYKLVQYIRIAFRPFAYNPVAHKLTLTKKTSITLSYDIEVSTNAYLKMDSSSMMNTMSETNNNISSTKFFTSTTSGYADYVIITTNAIVNNSSMLRNFINMKVAAGHSVGVVTESDFGSLTGQYPNGRAEKIRKWLQNNYLSLGIDYVLLIGNPDPDDPLNDATTDKIGDIPMKMCYPYYATWGYRDDPTDFFYADLVGNWDLDGDGIYGEDHSSTNATSPDPLVNSNHFSACWEGKVQIDYPDDYYGFYTFSDDGVRVWIDGELVIENWTDHLPQTDDMLFIRQFSLGLHDIKVEYYQHTGDAIMKLAWMNANKDSDRKIVPADHLYHYDTATSTWIPGGLKVSYYNNITLSGTPVKTGTDIIDNNWTTGDNGSGSRQTNALVSVGRIPVYANDYTALDKILLKTINYQTDTGNINWRKSTLLAMKPLSSWEPAYRLGEGIKNNITDLLGYISYRIYDANYNPPTPELWPCTKDNVVNRWKNNPYGIVTWWTHGNWDEATYVIDNTMVNQLNDTYPSIIYSASCNIGYPEVSGTDGYNLGYLLLKNGAIAVFCGSRVTEYSGDPVDSPGKYYNQCAAYFVNSYILNNSGNPLSAGDAQNKFNATLPSVGRNLMAQNLYGDPETYLMRITPKVSFEQKFENCYPASVGKTPTYLTLNECKESGKVLCQTLDNTWTSQTWIIEPVPGYTDRVRLKCKWNTGTYYYLTATGTSGSGNGDPVIGQYLRPGWTSQIWIIESGRNGSKRLKSAWSNSTYLTAKTPDSLSGIVTQTDHPEWSSQEWNFK